MALFQPSVVKKYIQDIDKVTLSKLCNEFISFFGNPKRQQNIRDSKEEQFQEGFLRALFVDILGYTLNPEPNYNLLTEQKNEKDSKKADGAILKPTGESANVIAVIELKGTDTTDLSKVELQAFNYKNNQKSCVYVITSNFEKLRFYIDNAIDFEEFNLFSLTEERFQLLYLCLAKDNLLNNVAQKIKEASVSQEDHITKKLYADYSAFKKVLFANITELNPEFDKLTLFKKTQKLLDRFLFIFFAEDRLLLPPNSIRAIVEQWEKLKELDEYKPLYERFIKYFGYMNTGYKGTNFDIFAYNGGLFMPDEILEKIKISDELLREHIVKLSNYDFDTEVDVNILGHIFEHSLNEIEEVQSALEGKKVDNRKSRRKKDGVFYTPKYITKYIVENTVGALCTEKKKELEINEDEVVISNRKNKKKELLEKIDTYRNWLLKLTICDPACGSGAFLNQALDFLINEHRKLDELIARITNSPIVFSDIENSILENNIFGVDINEEAVEIAKLSLWLKTAKKGRKLSKISNNIKCGNSLIDDPAVAGEKAFNWFMEFPQVFPFYRDKDKHFFDEAKKKIIKLGLLNYPDQGDLEFTDEMYEPTYSYKPGSKGFEKYGFDVVIGNPPYVRQELLGDYKDYFSKNYKVFNYSSDLFAFFYEKAFSILKHDGLFGFISNTFDKTKAAMELREWLRLNALFNNYIDFTEVQIFEGATTYPVIIIAKNTKPVNNSFNYIKIIKGNEQSIDFNNPSTIAQDNLEKENWSFRNDKSSDIIKKLKNYPLITENYGKTYYGVKTALNEAFLVPNSLFNNAEFVKPIFEGWELKKWSNYQPEQSLILLKSKWTKEKYGNHDEVIALDKVKSLLPEIINHLMPFEQKAKARYDKGEYWWELRNCAYYHLFEKPKIIFPNLQNRNKFSLDEEGVYINAPAVMLSLSNFNNPVEEGKFILGILNSNLIWYFLKSICIVRSGGYIEVKPQYFEQITVPVVSDDEKIPLINITDKIISLNKDLQNTTKKFTKFFSDHYKIVKLSNKLENWHELEFTTFISELNKHIKTIKGLQLSKKEEFEWIDIFNENKQKALSLKTEIEKTDKEINLMVYELYGLSEDEIAIVEGS